MSPNSENPKNYTKIALIALLLIAVSVFIFRKKSSSTSVSEKSVSSSENQTPATLDHKQTSSQSSRPREMKGKDQQVAIPSTTTSSSNPEDEKWKQRTMPQGTTNVPSGVALSPPTADVVVEGKSHKPASHAGVFERVRVKPEDSMKVSFNLPQEIKAARVAVRAVHGGQINGEMSAVLPYDKGVVSFTYASPKNEGLDEIVVAANEMEYVMPLWVQSPDSKIPAPNTINP